jgi:hypothetical protein
MLTYNDIRISQLNQLGESFVNQCVEYLRKNCVDKEELIRFTKEIEDCLFCRENYDGERMCPRDVWFIRDSWWNRYDELESYEDQQWVMGFIKDVFPDIWRP